MKHSRTQTIIQCAESLRRNAMTCRQRRGMLLSGELDWGLDCAKAIVRHFGQSECLWVSSQALADVDVLSNRAVMKQLGGETDLLIYVAHAGFDVDSFAAASGLIRAGGLLILLTPPLTQWPQSRDLEAERFFRSDVHESRFLKRFIKIATQSEAITILEQDDSVPVLSENVPAPVSIPSLSGDCRTSDQAHAVDAIIATATRKSNAASVLISDRGRGKSAALGIAAAQLLQQGCKHILVTAPRLRATAAVFRHAHELLPDATQQGGLLEFNNARLAYCAADELIATRPEADVLLVDEAAAIPVPMLAALLSHYSRIVFATTVHGYEGSGRGFFLRFYKLLDQHAPDWKQVSLHEPVRWAANDPLEKFIFDALLLNAEINSEDALKQLDPGLCDAENISREQLVQDEALLAQVFGLLVLAHYRTRPNDLRQLLDNPELQLMIMRQQQHVVGVAMLVEEGGIDAVLGQKIYQGQRRIQGQLLPQSLAYHAGIITAPGLKYLRIMRIAIHPGLQGRGLGTRLLQFVIEQMHTQDYDCLGTGFGVTAELLKFWQRLKFKPARLGLTREQSSGAHSLIMLYPFSEAGAALTQQAEAHMHRQLSLLLTDMLKDIEPELAEMLLPAQIQQDVAVPDMNDWQDVISFACAARSYESCIAAMHKLTEMVLNDTSCAEDLNEVHKTLLQCRVVQQLSWADVVAQTQLSGRAEAIEMLRDATRKLVEYYCPQKTRAGIKALTDL